MGSKMIRSITCSAVVLLALAAPLFAHHGTPINYANDTLFTSQATVTAFEYKNPHVRLFFDTKDEHGNVKHWSGELANPAQYARAGWDKKRSVEAFKPGTVLTVSYYISKAEENLPPDVGAALIAKIRDTNNERVLLDRF
jgi:hypothetical protein